MIHNNNTKGIIKISKDKIMIDLNQKVLNDKITNEFIEIMEKFFNKHEMELIEIYLFLLLQEELTRSFIELNEDEIENYRSYLRKWISNGIKYDSNNIL
jgi:hypothetical protein